MEALTRLLFEQPYLQGAVMALSLLVALAGWWLARYEPANAKRWALAAAIIAVLSVAGQFTASLVTTDRERIETMLEQARFAVERGDARAIVAMTDESLAAQGRNREEITRWLEDLFQRVKIHSPDIRPLQITFDNKDAATAIISGIATVETREYKQIATATYKFEFDRIAGQWKIVAIDPQENASRLPM
jgi:hypothetical protein